MSKKSEVTIANNFGPFPLYSTVTIIVNDKEVGRVKRNEQITIPIDRESTVCAKYQFIKSKEVKVYPGRQTELALSYNSLTNRVKIEKLHEDPPIQSESNAPSSKTNTALCSTCALCGKEINPTNKAVQCNVMHDGKKEEFKFCTTCYKEVQFKAIALDDGKVTLKTVEEIRKKCNVCGHVFCYTPSDVRRNEQLKLSAKLGMVASFSQTLATSQVLGNQTEKLTEAKKAQIVDFSRCPQCHSSDIVQVDETEAGRDSIGENATAVSVADELKKFKELLDMGAITQEEFDAKKKQLLGQ